VTFIIFFIIVALASLQYVSTFPLYIVLTIILYGPVLIVSLLVHLRGHLWMSRHLFGSESRHNNIIILWPFGEYKYDALSEEGEEEQQIRGSIRDDIKISIAGPIMHIPLCLFWFAMYAAVNNGVVSDFISNEPQSTITTNDSFCHFLTAERYDQCSSTTNCKDATDGHACFNRQIVQYLHLHH